MKVSYSSVWIFTIFFIAGDTLCSSHSFLMSLVVFEYDLPDFLAFIHQDFKYFRTSIADSPIESLIISCKYIASSEIRTSTPGRCPKKAAIVWMLHDARRGYLLLWIQNIELF